MAKRNSLKDVFTLDEIAKALGLPAYDDFEERSSEFIAEAGWAANKEARAEGLSADEAQEQDFEAQDEAQKELFSNWKQAVLRAWDAVLDPHELQYEETKKGFFVSPKKSWESTARQVLDTIDGVGVQRVGDTLEQFLEYGPYKNAREAVLSNFWQIRNYPEVYGATSVRRVYESSFSGLAGEFGLSGTDVRNLVLGAVLVAGVTLAALNARQRRQVAALNVKPSVPLLKA